MQFMESEMMFSAGRSRRLTMEPIIQSIAQLEKNYGKEGAEIIVDNTQVTLFGGARLTVGRPRRCLRRWAAGLFSAAA